MLLYGCDINVVEMHVFLNMVQNLTFIDNWTCKLTVFAACTKEVDNLPMDVIGDQVSCRTSKKRQNRHRHRIQQVTLVTHWCSLLLDKFRKCNFQNKGYSQHHQLWCLLKDSIIETYWSFKKCNQSWYLLQTVRWTVHGNFNMKSIIMHII